MNRELRITLALCIFAALALFFAGVCIDILRYQNARLWYQLNALAPQSSPGDDARVIEGRSRVL